MLFRNTHSFSVTRASGHYFQARYDREESRLGTFSDDFTVEFWFKPSQLTIEQDLVTSWDETGNVRRFRTFLDSSDRLNLSISSDGLAGSVATAQSNALSLSTGTWYHLAAVRDSTAGTVDFYLDGSLVNQVTSFQQGVSLYTPTGTANNGRVHIGTRTSGGIGTTADGLFNNVRIWSAARTDQEISSVKDKVLVRTENDLAGNWTGRDLGALGPRNSAVNPTPSYYPACVNMHDVEAVMFSSNGGTLVADVPFDGISDIRLDEPELIGRSHAQDTTNGQDNFNPPTPPGTQDGDLLIAFCGSNRISLAQNWSAPAGWVEAPGSPGSYDDTNFDRKASIFWKFADGEGASLGNFSISSGFPNTAVNVIAIRNAKPSGVYLGANSNVNHPSLTLTGRSVLMGWTLYGNLRPGVKDPGFVNFNFIREYNDSEGSIGNLAIHREIQEAGATATFETTELTGTDGTDSMNGPFFTIAIEAKDTINLTRPVKLCVEDADGNPLTGLTPTFLAAYDSSDLSSVTAPSIVEITGGFYAYDDPAGFTLAGIIDCGAQAVPRYRAVLPEEGNVFVVYDQLGEPQTGLTPTFNSFINITSGVPVSPPAVSELSNGLYGFLEPAGSEELAGVVQVGTGTVPEKYCVGFRPEQVASGISYRMRGVDGTLGQFVFWESATLDATGSNYAGPGPLTDIVVQKVVPS